MAFVKSKPEVPETTVLELALYKNYTWQGTTFERGKPYRFKNSDAMKMLAEQDTGRQVWQLYRPPVKRDVPKQEIVDATAVIVPEPYEDPLPGMVVGKKRIDVGSDDEIADVLSKVEEDGNVTV